MKGALIIAARDIRSAFETPLAYVLIACFLLVSGVLFLGQLHDFSAASVLARTGSAQDPAILERFSLDAAVVVPLLQRLVLMLIIFVPLITMRLLAEEERQGTMELLLTAPVSAPALVVGKWLAGWTLTLVPLALTLWFPLALVAVGTPDVAPLLTGYLGLALVSGTFTAVGLLASALTRSPLLAAVLGFVMLLASALCGVFAASAPPGLAGLLAWLSILLHFDALGAGVIASPDLVFFVLGTGTLLFVTHGVVDSRRWR